MENASFYTSGADIVNVMNLCQDHILDHLSFDVTMDHMTTKMVFTDSEIQDIKDECKNSWKVRELIQLIKKRGVNAYNAFLSALRNTRQEHVYDELKKVEHTVKCELVQTSVEQNKENIANTMMNITKGTQSSQDKGRVNVGRSNDSSLIENKTNTNGNVSVNIGKDNGSHEGGVQTKTESSSSSCKSISSVVPVSGASNNWLYVD